jgi:thioredoxin-like negative regulator of GroEL
MDPSYPAAAAGRAAMLAAQGKRRAAVRVLFRAAKRRPAVETLKALDATLEGPGSKQLLRVYKRLRRIHPHNGELALHHAAHLVNAGRNAEAETVLSELEGATGRDAALVESLRAKMLEGTSDPASVAEALRRALDKSLEA